MDLQLNHVGKWQLTLVELVIRFIFPLVLLLVSCAAAAVEFEELSVTELGGEYRLRTVSVLDVPARYVYYVITDYKNIYRINPSVIESKVLPANRDAVVRVQIHLEDTVGPFNFNVNWVGDVEETRLGELKVTTIPELSSFDSGHATWEIRPEGERTRVIHESIQKPDFFIPPLIGDYLVKIHMRDVTFDTFNRIECHANIRLEMDMENDPEQLKVLAQNMRNCMQSDRFEASLDQIIQ